MAGWWMRAGKGRATAALLLLCLLWAADSLRSDLFPHAFAGFEERAGSRLAGGAASFFLFALVSGLFAAAQGSRWPHARQLGAWAAVGLGLFAAPAVLVSLSAGWVSATTRVAIFSLVPVFTVVLEPHLGGDRGVDGVGGLMGALAAVAGTLSIFPLQIPGSLDAGASMAGLVLAAACLAAANCEAVRLARACEPRTIALQAAPAALAAAAGLAAASLLMERAAWSRSGFTFLANWTVLMPLPGLLILFWLMRRMTASHMTTRFVLAPLITVLIGMALEQPSTGIRIWVGIALIAAGAGWLLFMPAREAEARSLNLN